MTAHFDLKMMKNDPQKVTKRLDLSTLADFAEQLRLAGLRPTRQRVAIAALLLDGRHRHVSADSLIEEITSAGLRVSSGTVYNTLNQFTDAGLLRRAQGYVAGRCKAGHRPLAGTVRLGRLGTEENRSTLQGHVPKSAVHRLGRRSPGGADPR